MANKKKSQKSNQRFDDQVKPVEPKVVETEDRVENNTRPQDPQTRDMGDVVARDTIAEDGVKQTP